MMYVFKDIVVVCWADCVVSKIGAHYRYETVSDDFVYDFLLDLLGDYWKGRMGGAESTC